MNNITHIGLDVHKDTIAVATLRPGSTTCEERVIPNTPEAIRRWTSRLGDPVGLRLCYEAGPTGYDTHRLLTSLGFSCDVIAPALVPKRPGVRQKTDRSDARNLARFHRAGELIPIRVPSPAEEALRELIRAREDLKNDRRIARQRIRSFLLRHGRRPPAGATSRTAFAAWARTEHFEEPAAEAAFSHLLAAEEVRSGQLTVIEAEIARAALEPELAPAVGLLRCFRGIDTLSAVTLVAEVGDFRRFGSAAAFMAFTGLVPSEHSSGLSVRHGSITKTGNAHLQARARGSGLGLSTSAGGGGETGQASRGSTGRGGGLRLAGAVSAVREVSDACPAQRLEQGHRGRGPGARRLRVGHDDREPGSGISDAEASGRQIRRDPRGLLCAFDARR